MIARPMRLEDVESVYQIESHSFSIPWSIESLKAEIDNPLAYYSVIEQAGEIIGYGGLWNVLDEGEITNIAVHKNFRGQGIGSVICNTLIAYARERKIKLITLEVRRSNEVGKRMYTSSGFKEIACRKDYYQEPREDAIIMQLKL